jgi:hypothetical protein
VAVVDLEGGELVDPDALAELAVEVGDATAFVVTDPVEVVGATPVAVLAVVPPDLDAVRPPEPATDGDKTVAPPPLLVVVPTLMSSRLTEETEAAED